MTTPPQTPHGLELNGATHYPPPTNGHSTTPLPVPTEMPSRATMWARLQRQAAVGDMETARLAQQNGQIELTAEEWAELGQAVSQYARTTTSHYAGLFSEPAAPIVPIPPAPPSYPVPDIIGPEVSDLMAATGCTDRLAAPLILSSWSALAQHDYDAVGLRSLSPRPINLFFVIGEDVSMGKSSAARMAFQSHIDADQAVERRYKEARQELEQGRKQSKKQSAPQEGGATAGVSLQQGHFQEDRDVIPYPPVMITEDFTTQKLLTRLANGRTSQLALSAEAASVFSNYSLRAGSNRMQALSTLSKLYDGDPASLERMHLAEDIRLYPGYRFGLCWAAQPGPVRDMVFCEDAVNGFASRCFVTVTDAVLIVDPPGDVSTYSLDRMQGIIKDGRERQDRGSEFSRCERRGLPILSPTDEAKHKLLAYQWSVDRSKRHVESRHAAGYWKRAGEHAFRLAANLHTIRIYHGQQVGEQWSLHDLQQAMKIVDWHGAQIESQADTVHATEWARAAAAAADALPQAVHWTPRGGKGRPADGQTVSLRSWLSEAHPKGTGVVRGDKDSMEWVIRVLEANGWIVHLSRGRYAVNPWNLV